MRPAGLNVPFGCGLMGGGVTTTSNVFFFKDSAPPPSTFQGIVMGSQLVATPEAFHGKRRSEVPCPASPQQPGTSLS